jgi:Domain of unknown function (DUF4340)
MNLKTTIVLAFLVAAGTGAWFWLDSRQPAEAEASSSLDFLQTKLSADKITRVEVTRLHKPLDLPHRGASAFGLTSVPLGHGPRLASFAPLDKAPTILFVLEKSGQEWTLPGNWPVRPQETKQWLAVLTSLRSRFAPIVLSDPIQLKPYGLDEYPLVIDVTAGGEKNTLFFGEEPAGANRFTRATFVRLDGKNEVIQLGPGVFAALDRKADYFQQRRLFPIERVAKDENATEKVEQLDANAVEVETKGEKLTIAKKGKDWILQEADKKDDKKWKRVSSEDRLDPARRDAFLRAFPELWAEKFVEGSSKSLEDCGLKEPEFIVTVTKPSGAKIKLLIGKVSHSETRFEMKAGPPGMPPRMIKEEYRYAKLDKNDKLFEIKTDKLGDITVALDELRDPQLARFKTDDVKRLEMRHGDQEIVLVKVKESDKEKAKEKWRFEKPSKGDAEGKMVEELLEKLAALQARGKEIHDDIDPKMVGLDEPRGRIKITLEEVDKDDKKKADDKDAKKKTREIVYHLGMKAKEIDKLYVRIDAWPRVNQVSDELWKLVSRPELAYRPRGLWRIDRDAITRITIQADSAPYYLDHVDRGWKITGPIVAEAAGNVVETLADELATLKCERFEATKPKGLARFGLDKPAFKITVAVKDAKPHVLEIGNHVESGEGGRYARLGDGDAVFVLSEKLTGPLRKDPFDLLDKNLLTLNPGAIQRIRFQGTASPFTLEAKKDRWQVLDSPAPAFNAEDEAVKSALGSWRLLRADKIVAVGPKIDWASYGLDKPAATITVSLKPGETEKASEHVIALGKQAEGGGRFVRVDKKDVVAVLDAHAIEVLQPRYLDFVDLRALKYDGDAVTVIERKMKDADLELTRREDNWLITKPGTRDADVLTINDLLKKTSGLRAKRIAAYPAKDLQAYGLDKPAAIVTLLLETDNNPSKHVIKVGNLTKDKTKRDTDERYAMIDDRPTVIVLPAELSRHLVAPPGRLLSLERRWVGGWLSRSRPPRRMPSWTI